MNLLLLLKFTIIGSIGVGTNFIITWVFKELIKSNKYLANSIGYIVAMCFNFVGNRIWTYSSTQDNVLFQIFKFLIVVSVGVFLNHIIVYYFHNKMNLNFYFSKIIAVIIIFFWNFTMHTIFTFNYLQLI